MNYYEWQHVSISVFFFTLRFLYHYKLRYSHYWLIRRYRQHVGLSTVEPILCCRRVPTVSVRCLSKWSFSGARIQSMRVREREAYSTFYSRHLGQVHNLNFTFKKVMKSIWIVLVQPVYHRYGLHSQFKYTTSNIFHKNLLNKLFVVCAANNDLIEAHLSGNDVMSSNVVLLSLSHISIDSKPIQLLVGSDSISHIVHSLRSTNSSNHRVRLLYALIFRARTWILFMFILGTSMVRKLANFLIT